jgi:hypothetical protein
LSQAEIKQALQKISLLGYVLCASVKTLITPWVGEDIRNKNMKKLSFMFDKIRKK